MDYRFFEEEFTADIGFAAVGSCPEEMVKAAAEATMKVMVDNLEEIAPTVKKSIRVEASSLEMALFDLLGELIFYKDAEQLLLRVENVTLAESEARLVVLSAEARGEKIRRNKHKLIVDVKAVTMHRFKVEHASEGWTATVVLDI